VIDTVDRNMLLALREMGAEDRWFALQLLTDDDCRAVFELLMNEGEEEK
jgi:hypothetical protein